VEHGLRRVRRVVSYTIRTTPGTPLEEIRDVLAANGISVMSYDIYDHLEDRTFEFRLMGPAMQFDAVTDKLLARRDVQSILGG
jgi:hypothetical protein